MLTIGIHYLSDVASIDVRGKLIKGQGGFQLQMLIDKVLAAGTKQVLLNLTDVPVIDSMGIGEIVRAFSRVKDEGGTLKLIGLTDRVYGALKITQLLKVIECYKTEQEAVESFGGSANGKSAKAKPRKRKVKEEEGQGDGETGGEGEGEA
ncbi:MAG TPA: STAS domain-containing protein [Blastocatellia bacterium]|nr:STAS domain-containing protein [Blastocatellia bacterium]